MIEIATRLDDEMKTKESFNILKVINEYSQAFNLLDDYDHNTVSKPKGTKSNNEKIDYEECINIVNKMNYSESSNIFGVERQKGLESAIDDLYQTFDGKELYETVEEKASNFIYFIIKNHVFVDGNKRIGAILFLYFLDFNNLLYINENKVIEPETLTALTLLVAQSNPKEKDVIVDLIMNLINNNM